MPHSPADEKVDTYNGGDGLKEIRSDSGAMPVPALEGEVQEERELKRDLKDRQISMIAIGGSIGTGLVIGSGTALARSGPAGMFVGYTVMGAVCYCVMMALGEMSTYMPHKRGFAGHASRFVDEAFGFAVGYNYLFKYLVVTANNLNAAALVIAYWREDISAAVWISIFIVLILFINFWGVKAFGEAEFWMSFIKIITLVGLILMGIIIDLGGNPKGDRIGFRNWTDGKAWARYKYDGSLGIFVGFWSVMVNALFAYMGSELVGVTIGEASNPRKTVPKAIKKTFFRILFFYVIGVFVVGLIVPHDDPRLLDANRKGTSAAASPFVVAINVAGIKVLPSIVNAAILIFCISAANSDQYIASRTLYGLATEGKAPAIFTRCDKRGVPYVSLCFTALFCALAYVNLAEGGTKVFKYFVNTVTVFGGLTWIGILASHIRFMHGLKAQGKSRDDLPYKSPFQPYASWFALIFASIVVFFKGFDTFMPWDYKSFITSYIGIPVFIVLCLGYKLIYRTRFVSADTMDLQTDAREFDEAELRGDDEDEMKRAEQGAPIWRRAWIAAKKW